VELKKKCTLRGLRRIAPLASVPKSALPWPPPSAKYVKKT
jgi:hypothetical protein